MSTQTVRADVYTRVTNRIVADLEAGTPTWLKPWSAEHLAGKITRPLRGNGVPYQGVNVFMLWAEATAPITPSIPTTCRCRHSRRSAILSATTPPCPTS